MDERIVRAAALLQEASSLLTTTEPIASARPSASSASTLPNILNTTVNRARQMLNTSSRAGVFTRLNRNERLRASTSSSPRPMACQSKTVKKKPDVAIEFAMIEAPSEESKNDQYLKWDSVISDGIITCNENDSEKDIRIKVRDSLREKFSLLCADDFEFVKVRHKRISKPVLQARTEFNYLVVKKLAGQGMLYLQMKRGCTYTTKENEMELGDTILLKPYNQCRDDDIHESQSQIPADKELEIIDIVDNKTAEKAVDAGCGNLDSNETQVFMKPLPAFDIQPFIDEIRRESYMDPIEILQSLQKKLHKGRDLHLSSRGDTTTEGSTNYISVDRSRLLESTWAELKYVDDFRITFEIDYMGELAEDLGGPRLEWLESMNKEMQSKYFEHGFREQLCEEYYYVGIMCTVALLQNGQTPRIFPSEVLEKIFDQSAITSPCMFHLQRGFQVLGILEVFHAFPILKHLLQPASTALTARKVIQILQPRFSAEGSSSCSREKELYSIFVHYIREVASGRRSNLKLEHILSFATGTSEEPVLGYTLQPTITFLTSAEYNVNENHQDSMASICYIVGFKHIYIQQF